MKTPNDLFINKGSLIHQLFKRSENLTKLQKILLKYLPEQAHISAYESGLLHLICDDGMLASHVRYQEHALIFSLSKEQAFHDIKQIRVSVRPVSGRRQKNPTEKNRNLSKQNAAHLLSSADSIDDQGLKDAMIRLASHSQPQDEGESGNEN